MDKKRLDNIYKKNALKDIPWNLSSAPEALKQLVENRTIKACKALDIGCGTGNYAIYLASKGFDVTGIDISLAAVTSAKKNATKKNVSCNFFVADVLGDLNELTESFDFIYDWSVFHHIFPNDRRRYVANVNRLLNPGGKYLSVCFSEKNTNFGGIGKYRKTPLGTTLYFSSENEIKKLFEPHFKFEELRTIEIEGNPFSHLSVYAFVEKRG